MNGNNEMILNESDDIFIPPSPLNTAVLFLVFNRIAPTKKVFEAIRKAKPPRLYIAADGARASKQGEEEKVKEVREFILANIDWECKVETLFREKNLGCKLAVSGAITWFFENEEMGIILEDDCLPSQSFFWYCQELLIKYKNVRNIGLISGNNFQDGHLRGNADYFFSSMHHIWGWATWHDRWNDYDHSLINFENDLFIDEISENKKFRVFWKKIFRAMKNQEIDTWDYQWIFLLWKRKQLSVMPNLNLITNIGFGTDATHTIGNNQDSNMEKFDLIIKNHPNQISIDRSADEYWCKRFLPKNIFLRIFNILFK